MSKKVYETFALVKEIEVTSEEYEVSFQPVQKYSLNQHFLCLKRKKTSDLLSKSYNEWVNVKSTYKFFKTLKCKVEKKNRNKKIDLLQDAAVKGLPVQIQFEKEHNNSGNCKLCKVRISF